MQETLLYIDVSIDTRSSLKEVKRKRKGMKSSKNFFGFNLHAFVQHESCLGQDNASISLSYTACVHEERKKQFMWVVFWCVSVGWLDHDVPKNINWCCK